MREKFVELHRREVEGMLTTSNATNSTNSVMGLSAVLSFARLRRGQTIR